MPGTYTLNIVSTGVGTTHSGGWSPSTDAAIAAALVSGGATAINAVPAGPWTLRLTIDSTAIVLTGVVAGTMAYAGLPSGFRATSGLILFSSGGGINDCWIQSTALSEIKAQDHLTGAIAPSTGPSRYYTYDFTIPPTMLDIINNGLGVRIADNGGGITQFIAANITGTYVLDAWWYSPSLHNYSLTNPGGDYVARETVTPIISSIVPDNGPIAGGTSVTITGEGFVKADGTPGVSHVWFDDTFPATSVVVATQKSLTCHTPAHWRGSCNVVVEV